ncbi:MAG: hypothetical protein ACKO86_18010, partial [Dolichospermum sp.]
MQLLTPVDPNFSIKNTRNWLDSLRHELHKYQGDLQESITDFGGIKRLEDVERKWENAEQTIEDMENKLGIPFVDFKNIPFQEECKKIKKESGYLSDSPCSKNDRDKFNYSDCADFC